MFLLLLQEKADCVQGEGSSIDSLVPKGEKSWVQGYSIDSRVVWHWFTRILGIKDHSCRIQSIQYIAAYTFISH